MSVHQESLARPIERVEDPPELEYNAVRNDSLTMFGAAIGGAVLGMLLTLLVLAIINGGTLSFSGGERLAVMEASLTRIDENVGAVSYNVDVVAEQAKNIQTQLATVEATLSQEIESGAQDLAAVEESVAELSQSAEQFKTFLVLLGEALNEATQSMQAIPVE